MRHVFEMQTKEKNNMGNSSTTSKVNVKVEEILSVSVPGGKITEEGVRVNIGVALQYLSSWLSVMFLVSFFLDSLTVPYPLYTSYIQIYWYLY